MLLWLSFSVFIGFCNIAPIQGFKTDAAERAALIEAAICEAKEHASRVQAGSNKPVNRYEHNLASPEALAQGEARVLYEDMVHRAERKIRRMANTWSMDEGMISEQMTELLITPGSLLTEEEIAKLYSESGCQDVIPTSSCFGHLKYRTIDGTCNNLIHPTWGAANTPFQRLVPPQYEDGISTLRGWMQSTGSPLFAGPFAPPNPSPRIISLNVIQEAHPPIDKKFTHMLMQWGQFFNHDTNHVMEFSGSCPQGCPRNDPLQCAPFPVPLSDTEVQATRTDHNTHACLSFRRSIPACDQVQPMKLTQRDQLDGVSAFIDASQVYSNNATLLNTLIRDTSSGKGLLRTGAPAPDTTQPLLPYANVSGIVSCPPPLTPDQCYLAGDHRVNFVISLTVMHTIWMREHNRIAEQLSTINPTWDGERLFQEARQIVGAGLQKIAYKDYLPLILGDLYDQFIPEYSGYDINVYPNTINAFDAAAFRFGHSMIRSYLSRLGDGYVPIPEGALNIVNALFAPQQFVEGGGTDPILRGLLTEPIGVTDEFLNHFITNKLLAANITSPGLDLASLNIQRGRDHGLPPYFTWKMWALQECGNESPFTHKLTEIHLLNTYGSFDTVDLFVGGLAERPLGGGLVGATFACIFAKMFQAIRDGDRFYYENDDPSTGVFTKSQREQIEKISLSRVICDNSDNIQLIQPDAFRADQDRVRCSSLPSMDLTAWKESNADSLLDWNEIEGAPSHVQGGVREDDKLNIMNARQMDHEENHKEATDDAEDESIAELLSKAYEFVDMEDD